MTGRDVRTPIIQFGPVISLSRPRRDAVRLWDYVTGLAAFPSFAELKRSLREQPQLRSFGVDPGAAGRERTGTQAAAKPRPDACRDTL